METWYRNSARKLGHGMGIRVAIQIVGWTGSRAGENHPCKKEIQRKIF